MTNQSSIGATSTFRIMAAVSVILVTSLASTVNADLIWSNSAPVVDGGDQANFVGTGSDAGNLNGGDDAQTYIAGDRDWQGQTFTTGGNSSGYILDTVSLQHVTYGVTWWDLGPGWGPGQPFFFKIGTISGGVFTELVPESTAIMDATFPNGVQNGDGTGLYLTLTYDSPLLLAANTEYAFMVATNGPFFETNGANADNYAGGGAFTVAKGDIGNGVASTVVFSTVNDRVFHANLAAVIPEPSSVVIIGLLGMAGIVSRRRK